MNQVSPQSEGQSLHLTSCKNREALKQTSMKDGFKQNPEPEPGQALLTRAKQVAEVKYQGGDKKGGQRGMKFHPWRWQVWENEWVLG
jgi:hypothetical protein